MTDLRIKVLGSGPDIAHGNLYKDGKKVAEIVFHHAPKNPWDSHSEPLKIVDLFDTVHGMEFECKGPFYE